MSRYLVLRDRSGRSVRFAARPALVGLALTLVAAAMSVLAIGTGDYPMSPVDVVRTLAGSGDPAQEFIVNDLRLPRVVTALLAGLALGLAGAVFQNITRNPLGSPDVLGFSQGSTAGALVVIVLAGGSGLAEAGGALAGGLLTGVLIYGLAWRGGVHGLRLVLVGIGSAAVLQAVNSYLMTKADLLDATRATLWLTGSLSGRGWEQAVPLLCVLAVLVPVVLALARPLTMLEMGDDAAGALGVPAERVRLALLASSVTLTAVATAAAGPVMFVALSAPQLARRLTRTPGPNLLPAALMGAALLVTADWAAQRLFPSQLPVGVVTGVLGGVYLIWLLVTERKAGRL
ncbi:iron chelate uptake ABC transporter family permease subunit [Streptomyces capparidis]